MNTIILCLIFVLLSSSQLFSQRNHNKNPSGIRESKPKIENRGKEKQRILKPILNNQPLRRIKKPLINNISHTKIKVDRKLNQKYKYPKKKKSEPIIIEEYIPPIFEEIVEENGKGYCRVGKIFRKYEYLIMEEPYPYFPLRIVDASISYLFTDRETDYYNLDIQIEATYDNYFKQFAIIVDFGGIDEKLIIFNEHEDFLEEGSNYSFNQRIVMGYIGYKNLRIGYFDSKNNLFYPENFIPNKTDILVFVEKGEEKRRWINYTHFVTSN